jgi:hypothetical protein
LFRIINGESFLLNIQTECYFGLDEVGSRMFELLSQGLPIGSAFQRILLEYEVDAETLRLDFDVLITQLLNKGLLELDTSPPA